MGGISKFNPWMVQKGYKRSGTSDLKYNKKVEKSSNYFKRTKIITTSSLEFKLKNLLPMNIKDVRMLY